MAWDRIATLLSFGSSCLPQNLAELELALWPPHPATTAALSFSLDSPTSFQQLHSQQRYTRPLTGWDSIVCKFIHQNQNSMSKLCKIWCSGFDSCQIFLVRAPPKWSPESSSFLVRMHPLDVSNHSGAGCWCGNLGFHYWRKSCMLQIATVNYLGDVGGAWETKNQNQHSTAQKVGKGKQNRAWRQRQFHLFTMMDSVRRALGKNWKRSEKKTWTARIIALDFEKQPTDFSHKIQGKALNIPWCPQQIGNQSYEAAMNFAVLRAATT